MTQNINLNNQLAFFEHTILDTYCELMDYVFPHLTAAEQIVYQQLFRLSHVRLNAFAKCRYEDLAAQCHISLRTLQRALKSLRHKQLVTTVWQSHGATTFTVRLPSELGQTPAFHRQHRRSGDISPPLRVSPKPPLYNAFTIEDRELFLTYKRGLSPQRLNVFTEEAVEWLTVRTSGDPEAFSDDMLRDKVDELIVREAFGPERYQQYHQLFEYLYQN